MADFRRQQGRERHIECDGVVAVAVKLWGTWLCARCGYVLTHLPRYGGGAEPDGLHRPVT